MRSRSGGRTCGTCVTSSRDHIPAEPARRACGRGIALVIRASSTPHESSRAPSGAIMKNPLAAIKDKFENKAKLVEELEKIAKDEDLWVSRLNANKGLAHVSN